MTSYQTDLRAWLQNALNFIIEQMELARASSEDQLAAVEAAKGMIPCLLSRLKEDEFLHANFALVPGFIDHNWQWIWSQMAKEPPNVFAKSADDLIGRLNALKEILASPPPQST